MVFAALIGSAGLAPAATPFKGLPFTRFYSFDEIGDVSRGARLTFDTYGRIAAVQDGVFIVLNDNAWLDLATRDPKGGRIQVVVRDRDGTNYYGSQGSFGRLRQIEDGRLAPDPFLPADLPPWVAATGFTEILCRPEGVYFGGFNGLVFWDRGTRQTTFLEVPGLAALFAIGDQIFVSSHRFGVQELQSRATRLVDSVRGIFENTVIDTAAPFGDGRWLLSSTGRTLLVYEGGALSAWPGRPGSRLKGRVTAMCALPEGAVAVAIMGQGVYLLRASGEIETVLTGPDYHRVSALATNEPGVLWAATENGLAKILYGAPLSWFGQSLGLPVQWPQIVRWHDSVVIASNGRLYEPIVGTTEEPVRFQLVAGQPPAGTWGLASNGTWLLVGNGDGLQGRPRPGAPFQRLKSGVDAARVVMLGDVCLTIGGAEIAAFRCEGDTWRECAPRVPGVGYPAIVHAGRNAVWIELGANRAARVTFREGQIRTRLFDNFPWSEPRWINVSLLDDVAMLSGPGQGRLFFDEQTEQFVEHAPVEDVLARVPFWVSRVRQGADGTWWLSHDHGIVTATRRDGKLVTDSTTYRVLTDHTPLVWGLADSDVWISSGTSLYHVDHPPSTPTPDLFRVSLVSVRDLRSNRELMVNGRDGLAAPLPFDGNSIALRFFAGSYASKRVPMYEFRVNGTQWNSLEATSLVRLTDLHEGDYRLDVRLAENGARIGTPMTLRFAVAPPWYRTWWAYAAAVALGALALIGIVRLALYRSRARNAVLETMVAQRTEELKATMHKLQQETRMAATLAERNRLAGEIHDSLEQGFSGLMLHLETTAGLAQCPPEVRNGLTVARSMIAFSRNEVRHAVWDLHSPLLDKGGLEAALKNIVAHVAPEPGRATVVVEGEARTVGSTLEHHLLRIGQEAITNSVKHAGAAHLDIRLVFSEHGVQLTVRDDGRGFDPRAVLSSPGEHFGLRSLRSRASKIGAQLEIHSTPGRGATVTVQAPLVVPIL